MIIYMIRRNNITSVFHDYGPRDLKIAPCDKAQVYDSLETMDRLRPYLVFWVNRHLFLPEGAILEITGLITRG